jgi:reactive intermediate/imine deaminase
MSRNVIATESAPSAIGSYSQAIESDGTVFLSGQIPLVPETMKLVAGGLEAQLAQVFQNLENVAKAAGGTLGDVVKVTIYLTDLSEYKVVNEVMQQFFSAPFPARAVVGVAALPLGATAEAEATLVLGSSG